MPFLAMAIWPSPPLHFLQATSGVKANISVI